MISTAANGFTGERTLLSRIAKQEHPRQST
jgi:hypothetical protein